ncbi:MAG: hypothetical protein AAF544_05130, partial [Bacteroidota bacterium]
SWATSLCPEMRLTAAAALQAYLEADRILPFKHQAVIQQNRADTTWINFCHGCSVYGISSRSPYMLDMIVQYFLHRWNPWKYDSYYRVSRRQ